MKILIAVVSLMHSGHCSAMMQYLLEPVPTAQETLYSIARGVEPGSPDDFKQLLASFDANSRTLILKHAIQLNQTSKRKIDKSKETRGILNMHTENQCARALFSLATLGCAYAFYAGPDSAAIVPAIGGVVSFLLAQRAHEQLQIQSRVEETHNFLQKTYPKDYKEVCEGLNKIQPSQTY